MESPPPKAPRSTLSAAERERRSGRLWKAKEILRGAISNHPTDPRVLEAYGRVLHELGDRIEAGKYLFLAGSRDEVALSDIQLFFERHGRGHPRNLVGQFPAALRSGRWEELPHSVVDELREHGVTVSPEGIAEAKPRPSRWQRFLDNVRFLVAFLFLVFLFLFVVGAVITWGLAVFDFVVDLIAW